MNTLRRSVCTVMSAALALGASIGLTGLAAPNAAAVTSTGENIVERPAGSLTSDALPTVQINQGVVWDQAIVGDTVYVGGNFAHVRPHGAAVDTSIEPRKNLMAYNITTGRHTTWRPAANGGVTAMATSPDKSRLYIGGKFTTIDGQTRNRIAAFDTATGALVADFAPSVDAEVSAIEATNDTVYIGGFFASVNGVSRTRLAAIDTKGNLLNWAPTANSYVRGMALTNDASRLVIGGSFTSVNGSPASGMASLDPANGALQPWAANQVIRNGGTYAGIYGLRNDGKNIIIAAWSQIANRGFEGAASIDQSTGQIRWMADCHGDTYDVATLGGVVYDASHHHNCDNIGMMPEQLPAISQRLNGWTEEATGTVQHNKQANYADFYGNPAPSGIAWWPELNAGTYTGMGQAAWSLATNGKYMTVGGEFTYVNGRLQQGLTRFAVDDIAPKKMGARFSDFGLTAEASGQRVRLDWQANSDYDGLSLKYDVYRVANGQNTLVGSLEQDNAWWLRPKLGVTDVTAEANTSYEYFVRATDAHGNVTDSARVSVTTGSGFPADAANYGATVMADQPIHHWRFNENAGSTTVKDEVGTSPLTVRTGATLGAQAPEALGTAMAVNGGSYGYAYTPRYETNTPDVTVEAWVKTTSTMGGKVVGLGSSTGTLSMYADRHIYLTNTGQVAFGLYDGWSNRAIVSPNRVNDGQWHHLAGTMDENGSKLYVDGQLVGSNVNMYQSAYMDGYWHVGCDATANWPSAPRSRCLNGTIDEVAVYDHPLTATQVAEHFAATQTNKAPVANFTATCDDKGVCALDGSGSTDADGKVVSWQWKFDDQGTASGQQASHTFTTAGDHQITLVVVDDDGAQHSVTKTVTVTLPAEPEPEPQPEPVANELVADAFGNVEAQWGTADKGGQYSYGAAYTFSTDGQAGIVTATKGVSSRATLTGVKALDSTTVVDISAADVATAGGLYTRVESRVQANTDAYLGYVRWKADGTAVLTVARRVGGVQTDLKSVDLGAYTPGTTYRVSLDVTTQAAGGTLVEATAAKAGVEVGKASASDGTAALQVAGYPALSTYLSGSATAPVKVSWDNYSVTEKA